MTVDNLEGLAVLCQNDDRDTLYMVKEWNIEMTKKQFQEFWEYVYNEKVMEDKRGKETISQKSRLWTYKNKLKSLFKITD